MRVLEFKEKKSRENLEFPVEVYYINANYPRYFMPLHWHDECEIIKIESGKFQYDIGGEKGFAQEGDILFVNSEEFHAGIPDTCTYNCLVFNPQKLMQNKYPLAGEVILRSLLEGERKVNTLLPKEDEDIDHLIQKLFLILGEKRRGYELQVRGYLYLMFGRIIEGHYYQDAMKKAKVLPLRKAVAFIEREYHRRLTLNEIAQAANMSPKYFCSYFKSLTQHSPIEYLNHYRIEVARYRLLSGWSNITDLSYECGFSNLSYFIRLFKRIEGLTPKQYAASKMCNLK